MLMSAEQRNIGTINQIRGFSLELHINILNKHSNRWRNLFKVRRLIVNNLLVVYKTLVKLLQFNFTVALTSRNSDFHGLQLLLNKLLKLLLLFIKV